MNAARSLKDVAPAREAAYLVVRRVFEHDAWADRALHGEARRLELDTRDWALATHLTFGTVQRVATLDHVISQLAGRPVKRLDPPVLAALRLGVFQLAFLDRVPAHAAVGESVELVKRDSPRGAGLVNAVLRRASREARGLVERLPEAHARRGRPQALAPRVDRRSCGSPPTGRRRRARMLAADNEPAETALRANTLRIEPEALAAAARGGAASPSCPRRSCSTAPSTPSRARNGARACSCRSRAPR